MNKDVTKIKHAWKVCRKVGGKLLSAVQYDTCFWSVDYSTKDWITPPPKGNPFLFVFETRRAARRFVDCRSNGEFKILKVAVRNPQYTKASIKSAHIFDAQSPRQNWPQGTLFVDAVQVLN
jgi:hypothetical protein